MDLLYKIDPKEHTLIVCIEERNSKRILYLDTLKSLAKESDKEPLSLLSKIHLKTTRNPDTLTFQNIEVPPAQIEEALRLMAKTGRLFFEKNALTFVPNVKIYWRGKKHSEKGCTLNASLQILGKEVAIESCDRFHPSCFIYASHVGTTSSEVSWKWIELFRKGAVLLEGMQQKRFLEEEPPIIWEVQPEEKAIGILPTLILSDTTGCFANLWMDYGFGSVDFNDLSCTVQGRARLKKEEQQWEKDLLESGFSKKFVDGSQYYVPSEKAKPTLLFLLELGWKIQDARGRRVYKQGKRSIEITEKIGEVTVRGEVEFGDKKVGLRTVQQSRMWVELDENSVGLIDKKMELEGEWFGEALMIPKKEMSALVPLLNIPETHWEESLKTLVSGFQQEASHENSPPGVSFKGKLLPYQQKGVNWLSFLYQRGFSGLLADEMGLGKTVQVLAFFSRIRTNLPTLIVAPTSLLFNWRSEISRFLPLQKITFHSGDKRSRDPADLQGVILTSYALLRIDEELFSMQDFEVIVLDESNAIKTAGTQTARAANRLKGNFKIALSGTPIENRPSELASQFQFLMPDLFKKNDDLEMIRRKVRPFILRRRKEEVEIDLPEKIEQTVWTEMEGEQIDLYESYRSRQSNLLEKVGSDGIHPHRMEVLEAILRLRQICCDPRLLGERFSGAKIGQLLSDVEEVQAQGRKVLIYSQFTSMLQLIKNELSHYNPLYLDGSIDVEKRGELVKSFQEDPACSIFLLSLKAGGVGLNLTAADYVFIFDPWWNNAVENQAIDRAHRIGQKNTVIAKRYITVGTIEEKMMQLKAKKVQTASQLLDFDGENEGITEEDLYYLLA